MEYQVSICSGAGLINRVWNRPNNCTSDSIYWFYLWVLQGRETDKT